MSSFASHNRPSSRGRRQGAALGGGQCLDFSSIRIKTSTRPLGRQLNNSVISGQKKTLTFLETDSPPPSTCHLSAPRLFFFLPPQQETRLFLVESETLTPSTSQNGDGRSHRDLQLRPGHAGPRRGLFTARHQTHPLQRCLPHRLVVVRTRGRSGALRFHVQRVPRRPAVQGPARCGHPLFR